jgi:hypothetical protein
MDHSTARAAPELITAQDVLPTAELVDDVKRRAWDAAQRKAFALGWPVGDAGLAVMRMVPIVALMALSKLCPQVAVGRLARLLRLTPAEAGQDWNLAVRTGGWAGETASALTLEILEGER